MAFIPLYLFAGQFASFVVTSDINSQLRSMQAVNAAVSNEVAARIEKSEAPTPESLAGLKKRDRAWKRRQVSAWLGARILALGGTQNAAVAFPDFVNQKDNPYAKEIRAGEPFKEIVRDQDRLYLRVASVFDVGAQKLTVVCSEPLDQNLVADIAARLGEITLYASGITLDDSQENGEPQNNANQHKFETRLFSEPAKNTASA